MSIYPDPSVVDHELNYSTQIVQKTNYYPAHLQKLIDKINESTSPLEIEQAIDRFINFVAERRTELISKARLFRKRENINQRSLHVIVDQFNNAIQRLDDNELVFVAGPIGGGSNTLDHDLTESTPDKWSYLIQFDDKDIAMRIDKVAIQLEDNSRSDLIIFDDIDQQFGVQNLPFDIDNFELSLKRSYNYYEDLYQQASAINDFSPLIDSGIVAAQAILNANLIYFDDFPTILRERMDLYGLMRTHHPNFLTIQKIKTELLKDHQISILGYTFSSDNRNFSLINRTFFKGLKLFLLAENDLHSLNITFNSLNNNSDLKQIIEDFERQNQSFGTRGAVNQFEGRKSETIREIIGLDNLLKLLDLSGSSRIEVPIGYIDFTNTNGIIKYETNLNELEFPNQYLPAVENLIQPLDLIATGPLKIFKYDINEISVYLEIGDYRFRISKSQKTKKGNEKIIIYYNFKSLNDFENVNRHIMNQIKSDYIDKIQAQNFTTFDEVFEWLKVLKPPRKYELTPEEMNLIYKEKRPVTLYANSILPEYVISVLLKRILKEIRSWEDGINVYGSINRIMQNLRDRKIEYDSSAAYGEYPQYKLDSDMGLTASIVEIKSETKKDSEAQNLMRKLNKEIDEFNPDFFNFVINTLRRESDISVDNTYLVYNAVLDIFHDLKVAIVDFGLKPIDWASAENLQLWNTYHAQIRYIEYSLVLKLSEVIGIHYEGEELDQLTNYQYITNMVFTSFNGIIKGHKYVKLKKAYLFLIPKIEKYRDVLESSSSILELLGLIENLEEASRNKVRATLPKLPTIRIRRD